jgi:hypothetical protein
MARNGPDRLVWRCPLLGVDRKWFADGQNDAIDSAEIAAEPFVS